MVTTAVSLVLVALVAGACGSELTSNPDSVRLVTEDIDRFWQVLNTSDGADIAPRLRHDYLEPGTPGLQDFIDGRIISARRLAQRIDEDRHRYEAARSSSQSIAAMEPALRDVFRKLKLLYPAALFPDVYFVIGRLNSGGTTSRRGLIIGAEMYPDPNDYPVIVAHELIHVQQGLGSGRWRTLWRRTLLERAFLEGSADFLGEMISGDHINHRAHEYGLAREAQLWGEFRAEMGESDVGGWLYSGAPDGRPADLGYFFGYRIARAYYERAEDKSRAVEELLNPHDVAALLIASGYDSH